MKVYNSILEPFIIIFTSEQAFANDRKYKGKSRQEVANEIMLSLEYKQTAFKLALMGDDNVVIAFNNLMQFVYNQLPATVSPENTKYLMKLLGNLLLEIRKGVGNENTCLDNFEILEWLIKDIRKYRD